MKFSLLDPLRGVAAFWVFASHYQFGPWLERDFPLLASLASAGYLGVPLFFVISGYCITGSARSSLTRDEPSSRFLYRRCRRVYPTFWFSLIFAIGLPFWLDAVSALKSGQFVWPQATLNNGFLNYSVGEWLSMLTLTRVFADVPNATDLMYKFTSLNAVYWTLALEVQFYAVVALAMHLKSKFYLGLAGVTVIGIVASLMPSTYVTGIFLPYWPMFATGVGLYWLVERGVKVAVRPAFVVALAVAFAGYLATMGPVSAPLLALAFGLWLLIAYPLEPRIAAWAEKKRGRFSPSKVVLAFGLMSYSLYLMHTKLHPAVSQIVTQVLPAGSFVADIAVILVACAGAYVFYWFAERPFAGSIRSKPDTGPSVPAVPRLAGAIA